MEFSGNGADGSIEATSRFFGVASYQATVSNFGFGYAYSGLGKPPTYSCSLQRHLIHRYVLLDRRLASLTHRSLLPG